MTNHKTALADNAAIDYLDHLIDSLDKTMQALWDEYTATPDGAFDPTIYDLEAMASSALQIRDYIEL